MKKAIILCSLDGYANSVKPNRLKFFLEKHGYDVDLYSTSTLNRLGRGGIKGILPYPRINYIKLYFFEAFYALAGRQANQVFKKNINSFFLRHILNLRGVILKAELSKKDLDLLICENNFDEAIILERVAKVQILDVPTPFAEELFYGNEINEKAYHALNEYEKKVYSKADFVSFHWYTYAEFVKKNKYNGTNIINIGWGTDLKKKRVEYASLPKIVFLGYLGGYWSNLPLLEKLSKLYPHIDVYGGPPAPNLKINYMGHTTNSEILTDYQFGLITITDDPLRRIGFSAKHLDYFSYGLPVFTPEWREDPLLEGGSIYYNSDNFLQLVQEYSNREKWEEKSNAALAIAKKLNWEGVFDPLRSII